MKDRETHLESMENSASPKEAEQIAINGFNQVLELLRVADPAFRQSLLKRISAKDPNLALKLARELGLN